MRIAVTGASGFVGRDLMNSLAETAYQIAALVHKNKNIGRSGNITTVQFDINNPESLRNALSNIDVLIHLVGIIAETKQNSFQKTVAEGTKAIVKASIESGVQKIIYLSALGTSENAESKYHQSKWEAEEAVRNSGVDYVILRPSLIFGPNDKSINMIINMVRRLPIVPIIGDGKYKMQPIFIGDLSKIMLQVISDSRFNNRTIELGGPEKLKYVEIIAILKKVLNKRRLNFYIPVWPMKAVALLFETMLLSPPVTRDQIKMLTAGNICSGDQLDSLINLELTAFEDGLKQYLR